MFREHRASFGPYLRGLRAARGLSLRDASSRLGITFAKLQKMETGGRFRIDSVALFGAVAALFERPMAEVLAAAGVRLDAPAENADDDTVWRYQRGGLWTRVADFVWNIPDIDHAHHDDMTAAGYGQADLVYGYDGGITVEVHRATAGPNRANYEYFVWVNIGESAESVVVPRLPDLLALLNELKPLTDRSQ
jgi:transcriptional regulator with XRE-family HTH domain